MNVYPQGNLPGSGQPPSSAHLSARRDRHRQRWFVAVFVITALLGLFYVYSRDPVYQTSAWLALDFQTLNDAGAERRQSELGKAVSRLQARALLDAVAAGSSEMPGHDVRRTAAGELVGVVDFLAVHPDPEAGLIELRATGAPPAYLAALANTWLDLYLARHANTADAEAEQTRIELERRLAELDRVLEEKRQALDEFRRDHDIVSLERDENRVLSRQRNLTQALARAEEELVAARAERQALRSAAARGESVVQGEDSRSLANLRARASDLRERLKTMEQNFTAAYLAMDPDYQSITKNLNRIQGEIDTLASGSRQAAFASAEQAVAAAGERVATLNAQLADYRREAMNFAEQFERYRTLVDDHEQLNTLRKETHEQLVKAEVRLDQTASLRILERAAVPAAPVAPAYTRDAGIALALAALFGLLAALLHDFFNRQPPAGGEARPWPVFYPVGERLIGPGQEALPGVAGAHAPALEAQAGTALPAAVPVPPAAADLQRLFAAADPAAQALVGLMLAGLAPEEAARLRWEHLDPDTGTLSIPEQPARRLAISPGLGQRLQQYRDARSAGAVWPDAAGEPLAPGELAALLHCAALDAGIGHPQDLSLDGLRQAYLGHLLDQGARLSDLRQVAGYIAPSTLQAYAAQRPETGRRAWTEIEVVHPLLQQLAAE